MRAVVVVVSGLLVLLGRGTPSAAQDGPPVETVVGYYEDENPASLGIMLYRWNVCFERFVTLNPDIEIDNIAYGTPVLLPKNEPCYDPKVEWLPTDGQMRLKYFEDGEWLLEPYYTNEIVYRYYNSIEQIMHEFSICREDLLAENYQITAYGVGYLGLPWGPTEVFIPTGAERCVSDWQVPTPPPPWPTVEMHNTEFTPMFLMQEYNICPEEMPGFWGIIYGAERRDEVYSYPIPPQAPPCYNDDGKRLIYFDLSGHPLDQPEYSDLQVYPLQPGETAQDIAAKFGVCLNDLISLNNFPQLPISVGEIEIFIPEVRPCPSDITAQLVGTPQNRFPTSLRGISLVLDVCVEDLAPLNPHLSPMVGYSNSRGYYAMPTWVLVPKNTVPCYITYKADRGESIFDIERKLNICIEAFIGRYPGRIIDNDLTVLYFRRDTPPCYTDQGQRLHYEPVTGPYRSFFFTYNYDPAWMRQLTYSELPTHVFGRADTVYTVSRKHNVCVPELLAANPELKMVLPEGLPVYIPVTRPCYDEATGMPLIYEDESGVPLDEPRVGDKLIYYGTEAFGHVSYYYNVCENRIRDANAAKLAGEAHYLGWIIPHDRPPCYDEDGYVMDVAMRQHVANGGIVHTVQFAETLSEIAEQYDKSIYWIAAANNLSSVDMIWTEQRLIIPDGVTTRDVKLISAALIGLAAVGAVVMWRRKAK